MCTSTAVASPPLSDEAMLTGGMSDRHFKREQPFEY